MHEGERSAGAKGAFAMADSWASAALPKKVSAMLAEMAKVRDVLWYMLADYLEVGSEN